MRKKEATSGWNPSNLIDVHCGWAQTKGNGLLQQQPNLEPNVATVRLLGTMGGLLLRRKIIEQSDRLRRRCLILCR